VITEAEISAVLDTLRSGWLTMGPRTQAFEAAFAESVGASHAVAVGSGAAAVHLALLGAGYTPGDPVNAGPEHEDLVRAVGGFVVPDAAVSIENGRVQPGDVAFHPLDEQIGLGGVVTTEDEGVAARVRSLRGHALTSGTWDRHRGHAAGYDVIDIGFNYRMDEARAALALAMLSRSRGA
jgi:dTDP-4-amino-4,6-dideoxygalactose transaminase